MILSIILVLIRSLKADSIKNCKRKRYHNYALQYYLGTQGYAGIYGHDYLYFCIFWFSVFMFSKYLSIIFRFCIWFIKNITIETFLQENIKIVCDLVIFQCTSSYTICALKYVSLRIKKFCCIILASSVNNNETFGS